MIKLNLTEVCLHWRRRDGGGVRGEAAQGAAGGPARRGKGGQAAPLDREALRPSLQPHHWAEQEC